MSLLKSLDPRFRILVSFARDDARGGSVRRAALSEAEKVAVSSGYEFGEALRTIGITLDEIEDTDEFDDADDDGALSGELEDEPVGQPQVDSNAEIEAPGGEHSEGAEPSEALDGVVEGLPSPSDDEVLELPGGQIAQCLQADPNRSDREIARECEVSPTTVGRLRGALGLSKAVRTVTRRGKQYEQAVGDRS